MSTNLADLVASAAANRGGHPALIGGHGTTTWSELDGAVNRTANAFTSLGLEAGDRVAIVMANVVEIAFAYYGALRAGLVVVPVNPAYTAREIHPPTQR